MTARRLLATAFTLGALGVLTQACAEEVVTVSVRLAKAQRGFSCRDGEGVPLVQRAVDSGAACVVLDFIRYDETPSCRIAELRDACCGDGCDALRARKQMPLDIPTLLATCAPNFDPDCATSFVLAALHELTWLDAPQGLVSIRVTVTNQDCEPITDEPPDPSELGDYEPFAADTLIGCVFSCPADLTVQESELVLDLDVVDTQCEPVVAACANLRGPHCDP